MPNAANVPGPIPGAFPPIPMVPVRDDPVWEYQRVERNLRTEGPPTEDELNALGTDGWELSGMYTDLPFLYLFFKRIR